jgi:hypothetical protein
MLQSSRNYISPTPQLPTPTRDADVGSLAGDEVVTPKSFEEGLDLILAGLSRIVFQPEIVRANYEDIVTVSRIDPQWMNENFHDEADVFFALNQLANSRRDTDRAGGRRFRLRRIANSGRRRVRFISHRARKIAVKDFCTTTVARVAATARKWTLNFLVFARSALSTVTRAQSTRPTRIGFS